MVISIFIMTYFITTWRRGREQRQSSLRDQALAWLAFAPFTFMQGIFYLGCEGSWLEIVEGLAYFYYTAILPFTFASILAALSSILEK